jgi:hypothetical protein
VQFFFDEMKVISKHFWPYEWLINSFFCYSIYGTLYTFFPLFSSLCDVYAVYQGFVLSSCLNFYLLFISLKKQISMCLTYFFKVFISAHIVFGCVSVDFSKWERERMILIERGRIVCVFRTGLYKRLSFFL